MNGEERFPPGWSLQRIYNEVDTAFTDPWKAYRQEVFFKRDIRICEKAARRVLDEHGDKLSQLAPRRASRFPKRTQVVLPVGNTEKLMVKRFHFHYGLGKRAADILGNSVTYEVPLSPSRELASGNIDLITYEMNSKTLFLVEAKGPKSSNDSLLRAGLEICTYDRLFHEEGFLTEFGIVGYPS